MAAKKAASKKVQAEKPIEPQVEQPQTAVPLAGPHETPAKPTDNKNAVIVCDPHGHPHRTYSLEVHGESFRELAEKYIASRPGWSLK